MFEIFETYLKDKGIFLSEEEIEKVQSLAIQKKIRKHQLLLQENNNWQYNAFVCSGSLRMYYIDDKGEHILRFAFENWWVGDRESYTMETPSKYNIEAIETAGILLWTKDSFNLLKSSIPALKNFMDSLIVKNQIANQNRIHSALADTLEERYNEFLKIYPGITNRIPLHMIASYLGVSRETLSRIRNQRYSK